MRSTTRILIIGFGDVGERVAALLMDRHFRSRSIAALVRDGDGVRRAKSLGVQTIRGDLSRPESLHSLSGKADVVFHFAPPPGDGDRDTHTRHLIAALTRQRKSTRSGMLSQHLPRRLVYISTTGVYGDCSGDWIDETRPLKPATDRARRRVDAEHVLCDWGRRNGVAVTILRAPGIYALNRLPLERLRKATPALRRDDDVFTNHIHAEDLARAAIAAIRLGNSGRVYNVVDDSALAMGEYFDLVADAFGLARPPRISRAEAVLRLSPALMSFMSESRRIGNCRLKRELRFKLRYPTVDGFLREIQTA